jgi:4-amino-4-deoxy-L-arabinose transferase-like glycosyltransferase
MQMETLRAASNHKYALLIIIFVALLLRFVFIYNASYGTTQELFRDLKVVYDFFENGKIILLGPSASLGGFNFGVGYYYLLAPFVYLFDFAPYGALLASAICSVVAIYVLYRLLWLWTDSRGYALFAAFVLAISLYDIQNAYYVSNPNFVPLFFLLTLFLYTQILRGAKHWWLYVLCGICFGIATQLHATALFVLPLVMFVVGIRFYSRLCLRMLIWFLAGWIVTFAPYIRYEFQHGFINTLGILRLGEHNFGFIPNVQSSISIAKFWTSALFFKNVFFDIYESHAAVTITLLLLCCVTIIMVCYAMRGQWHVASAKLPLRTEARWLLAAWFTAATLMFLFFAPEIQSFYFLVLWPLPIILLSYLLHIVNFRSRTLAMFALIIFVIIQGVQTTYFAAYIYHPELNHRAIESLFKTIRDASNGRSYKIINTTKHTNLFAYYDTLTMTNSYRQTAADYLFFVVEPGESILIPNEYREQARFPSGVFELIRAGRSN